MAKFMLIHGFYKNEEELENLLDPIIGLLDGTVDLVY